MIAFIGVSKSSIRFRCIVKSHIREADNSDSVWYCCTGYVNTGPGAVISRAAIFSLDFTSLADYWNGSLPVRSEVKASVFVSRDFESRSHACKLVILFPLVPLVQSNAQGTSSMRLACYLADSQVKLIDEPGFNTHSQIGNHTDHELCQMCPRNLGVDNSMVGHF